jgi:Flp pilus assembly protein TadD
MATVIGLLLIAGCAAAPMDPTTEPEIEQLLSGELVFGEPVRLDEVPDVELIGVSEEMRAFIRREVGETGISSVKFRRMFRGLTREGYFNANYLADSTRTAADTFQRKTGNCLSYTSMFVALAREAGLDARFQIVDVPPNWDADSGYLIRYTHVNVVLKGFRYDKANGSEFSVDFNDVLPEPEYSRREISDAEATALYYANRSVHYLRAGSGREAFAHLKKAIHVSPQNSDLWINLGALYAKEDALEQALSAYQVALALDPRNRGAISGLGRTHQLLGNVEEAEYYNEQVKRYRQKNPFFHFAIAQAEFENARYQSALDSINTAIDLKYRNGRFHFLKGLTQYKLGDTESAQVSFRRADRFGNYRDLKQRYVSGVAQAGEVTTAPN